MADLVTSESRRYLHGIQNTIISDDDTGVVQSIIPSNSQLALVDQMEVDGTLTVYGDAYVTSSKNADSLSGVNHNAIAGRDVYAAHPASSVSLVPVGSVVATNMQSAVAELDAGKVASNPSLTPSTKTKITYDSKGLVTAGSDATASDIVNTPSGNISSTTVQAAINELGSEKAQLAATLTNQRVPFANASGSLTDNANFYYVAGTGLRISDTTASTSKSTGSLVVGGGVGIVGKLNIGNSIDVVAPYDPNPAGLSSPKMLRLNNGGSISLWVGASAYAEVWMQGIQDDGSNNFKDITLQPLGGTVRFSGHVPSTSTTTGSLVVAGGVGCGDYFTGKYRSSDGTAGLTATRTFYAASSSGGATNVLNTVTIKDGIITSWTQA